jgi:protein TonB
VASVIELDNPWRRLPWSLPLALAICTAVLWELGDILERPPAHAIVPASIEAELIDEPPAPVEKIPAPPQRPKVEKKIREPEPERSNPAPQPAEATQPAPVALPVAPAAPVAQNNAPAPPLPVPARPPAPPAPDAQSAGAATLGAQAIVRPLPKIPDDLLEEAFNAVAVARFHVAADGSATYELAKPTPNPKLNRLLLEKLKEWRFFPAVRDGKPVASIQEVRITFEVK